jgi:4'-phosphopantetheinyl transferase
LLCEVLGAPDILYEEGGKPYAAGGPHFNLSHSGNYALLAVDDDGPVGADVEKWEPWYEAEWRALSRHSLHEDERAAIKKSAAPSGTPPAKFFFDLWTLKESYMKMLGKGLALDPSSFAVKIDGRRASISTDPCAHLRVYDLEGYSVSLCSLHDGPRSIREVGAL